MEIKTVIDVPQAATETHPQKQAYKSPLLRVYGAVHQFTQGSGGQAADAMTMTMM